MMLHPVRALIVDFAVTSHFSAAAMVSKALLLKLIQLALPLRLLPHCA